MAESKLKADQIVAGGIRLLQLLTAAPNQLVSIARACSALGASFTLEAICGYSPWPSA